MEVVASGDRLLGGLIRQVMVPSAALDYFRDDPALNAGREVARLVLGTERVGFIFDRLISKEPGQRNEMPWHNDYAYSGVPVRFLPAAAPSIRREPCTSPAAI